MSDKKEVHINYGLPMASFMLDVMKTLAEQKDCEGINEHGLEDHHGGEHIQSIFNMGNANVNFRFFTGSGSGSSGTGSGGGY